MKNNNGWHVYREWICDSENKIVFKPLSFWMEYYGLETAMWKTYQMWKSAKPGSTWTSNAARLRPRSRYV